LTFFSSLESWDCTFGWETELWAVGEMTRIDMISAREDIEANNN
jgi:hypothetical protein